MTPDEIKALREHLGLSKAAFADRLGITVRLVNYWESGGRAPGKMAEIMLGQMARAKATKKGEGRKS